MQLKHFTTKNVKTYQFKTPCNDVDLCTNVIRNLHVLTRSFKPVSFLHLYLLFSDVAYGTVSAILLLDDNNFL